MKKPTAKQIKALREAADIAALMEMWFPWRKTKVKKVKNGQKITKHAKK